MAGKKPLTLSELKKQLGREKKKEEKKQAGARPQKVKYKATAGPQVSKQTKVRSKEEEARRKFFARIIKEQDSLNEEELLEEIKMFGTDPGGQLFRRLFMDKLSTQLSSGLIYEYAQGYLKQGEASNVFFAKFMETPEVKERIEKIGEKEEDEEEATDMAEDLEKFLTREEEEKGEEYIPKKTGKVAKLVDRFTLEEIAIPTRKNIIEYARMEDSRCMEWYRNTPWLAARATSIFVHPLRRDAEGEFFHDDDLPENRKMIGGRLFYRVNQNFIKMQCGVYKNRRTQNGDVFTFFNEKGEPYEVNLVFEVRGKLVPQTEEIFQAEKKSYFQLTAPLDKKVRKLMERTVDLLSEREKRDLKDVMEKHIVSSLTFVSRNSGKMSQEYIQEIAKEVVEKFYEKESAESIKVLLEKYSLFLVFFDSLFLSYAKTFYERLEAGAYSSDDLINLTNADVLPEVYLDPRVDYENREIFTRFLSVVAAEIYIQLSYAFYYTVFPNERIVVIPMRVPLLLGTDLPEDGLRGICRNKNEIPENISPYNLYIYKDSDGFYCFDLLNLPDRSLLFGEHPETGEELPDEVVEEIYRLSNLRKAEEAAIRVPATEKVVEEEKLSYNFLKLVIEDVLDLEDELGKKGENLLEKLTRAETKAQEKPGPKTTKKVEDITEEIENICGYCQKYLKDDQPRIFSTVVQGKGGSKLLEFCNIECFDKLEKWPKLRKRAEKLEEESRIRMEALEKLEKGEEKGEEGPPPPEKLPCFYPAECETNPYLSDVQIREIAEECGVPTRTPKGLRVRKNLCKDLKEKNIRLDEEFTCGKCGEQILPGQERNLKDEVLCRRCVDMEALPLLKEIAKKEKKMAEEKEKICVQCEKFIGDQPAWRSSDWGGGVVHYCSLKCFKKFDPGSAPRAKINEAEGIGAKGDKEIEREKREQFDEIFNRKLVESKLIGDKPKQKEYFEKFSRALIDKKYREKFVEYLFHIHPDDRWDFMEKIKKKKLTERRTYIENLFSMDEDIEELEKEKYGTEEKLNEYENKNKEIREHKDLYDFEKNFKSKSLIYQAFLKKIREQDPRNRSLIYLFFVGISDIGKQQKKNPVETRQLVWTNFFTYVSKLKTEEKRNFINLLFNDDFDLYKYVQE